MNAKGQSGNVLVVGSGPAGLEATRALAERGYDVAMAEATKVIGGRVTRERMLPGLSAWGRVADYREYQISQKSNVETYLDNELNAEAILELGFENICIATGAHWRRDGVGRQHVVPITIDEAMPLFTPDDIMDGRLPTGKVVIYDDDHYYMGGVLAERLVEQGCELTLITPSACVSDWTVNTLEQHTIQKTLLEMGVNIVLNRGVTEIGGDHVVSDCTYTAATQPFACEAVLMVTAKLENKNLYTDLNARQSDWADAGIKSVQIIGDANAPGPIAWATYAGHRYARELDMPAIGDALPFRREITELVPG
jgi:dimethylamine/trimethylamine dehydrogenase